jgi:hypothetical protein
MAIALRSALLIALLTALILKRTTLLGQDDVEQATAFATNQRPI